MITAALLFLIATSLVGFLLAILGTCVGGDKDGDGCAIALFGFVAIVGSILGITGLVKLYA